MILRPGDESAKPGLVPEYQNDAILSFYFWMKVECMVNLFWIAIAGALGSLSRYGLFLLSHKLLGWEYPWGTTFVNILGCFLFGLIWAMARDNSWLNGETRTIILVGFMGSFTTFSTFIFEIDNLIKDGKYAIAGVDLMIQLSIGLALLMCGIKLGRYIIS